MRTATVTYDDVAKVCDKLAANKLSITARTIRHELGSGSFTTINRYVKEWRGEKKNLPPSKKELPLKLVPSEPAQAYPKTGPTKQRQEPPKETMQPTCTESVRTPLSAPLEPTCTESVRTPPSAPLEPSCTELRTPPSASVTPVVQADVTDALWDAVLRGVQSKDTLVRVACSVPVLVVQVCLVLFLVEDSARFFAAAGQFRPLEMAVLTEAALVICALASPAKKVWWLGTKAMLVGIIVFMVCLMQQNTQGQFAQSNFQHQSLRDEILSLEKHNNVLRNSIADLEARSRITAAGELQHELTDNYSRLTTLRAQQRQLARPVSEADAKIMFYFRLGAILLTILLAAYQRSLWAR